MDNTVKFYLGFLDGNPVYLHVHVAARQVVMSFSNDEDGIDLIDGTGAYTKYRNTNMSTVVYPENEVSLAALEHAIPFNLMASRMFNRNDQYFDCPTLLEHVVKMSNPLTPEGFKYDAN